MTTISTNAMANRHVGDNFTCECCGGTFQTAITEQTAAEEFNLLFPNEELTPKNAGTVCDDCFNKIMAACHPKQ